MSSVADLPSKSAPTPANQITECEKNWDTALSLCYLTICAVSAAAICGADLSAYAVGGVAIGLMAPHALTLLYKIFKQIKENDKDTKCADVAQIVIKFIVVSGIMAFNAYALLRLNIFHPTTFGLINFPIAAFAFLQFCRNCPERTVPQSPPVVKTSTPDAPPS
jgi:hypothetical protein